MNSNKNDRFETTVKLNKSEENFFLTDNSLSLDSDSFLSEPSRRLNDYDFNLLKEDAYKDIADDLFKLEYKISKIEGELNSLDSQIQAAKDINESILLDELISRKTILLEDYESLLALYNDKSVHARLTDGISRIFGGKIKQSMDSINQRLMTISDIFMSKLPKSLTSVLELKKSLSKLENINKSVDDLMSLNIPYGENINKYEQLSKYIIKANSIQTQISKYLKNK